jgi:tRNA (guanosine-2'-O-)-methyltransferase
MSRTRFEKFKTVLHQRQPDMAMVTDQVHKAQNISAMLRTADAVGISTVHMVQPARGRLVYHHTAGGSSRFVKAVGHPTIEAALQAARDQGLKLYAAQWSDRAISYREADYTEPFALVMGAEKYGLSETASAAADVHLTIPMAGMVESYNVSVAAAIILQEALHQRLAAGHYQRPVEEDEHYQRTLFRWAQPKMARFCDQRGLPYPQLDEDGDVIPPTDAAYRRRT